MEHLLAVDAHRGINLEFSGGELPHPFGKRLAGEFLYFCLRERERTLAEHLPRAHLLADHDKVGLQQTVFGSE